MLIKRLFFLLAFFFTLHLCYSQEKATQQKVPVKTQTQKKTDKKPDIKKVPLSTNKTKANSKQASSKLKTNIQKQKMKKFLRKTAVKRRHGLKRK